MLEEIENSFSLQLYFCKTKPMWGASKVLSIICIILFSVTQIKAMQRTLLMKTFTHLREYLQVDLKFLQLVKKNKYIVDRGKCLSYHFRKCPRWEQWVALPHLQLTATETHCATSSKGCSGFSFTSSVSWRKNWSCASPLLPALTAFSPAAAMSLFIAVMLSKLCPGSWVQNNLRKPIKQPNNPTPICFQSSLSFAGTKNPTQHGVRVKPKSPKANSRSFFWWRNCPTVTMSE